ncbi:SpoIID/LytB domain-containing protein [Thermincola ferriacetica]
MRKRIKVLSVFSIFVFLLSLTMNYALAGTPSNPNHKESAQIELINSMVDAMNSQDIPGYVNTFTKENRVEMEKVVSENIPFFKEKSASLVNIKKLPFEIGSIAAALSEREGFDPSNTEIYYVALKLKVDKEQKWLYNGVNHKVIVLTKENNEWKIARISVPNLRYLVDNGQGFGTKEENQALVIEDTMEKKGLVLNNQGEVIENGAASLQELEKERKNSIIKKDSNVIAAADEHVRPDHVTVYFTKSANRTAWNNQVRADVPLWDYCRDVLPNEWVASWYTSYANAVRAGALAVKGYGWYHYYHPKWNYSPYYADVKDNTDDQTYLYNSRKDGSDKAINDVGGIGIDTPYKTSTGTIAYKLFETQYLQGTDGSPGTQYSGKISIYGTKYWAAKGKDYAYMVHYYYDYSDKTGYNYQARLFTY